MTTTIIYRQADLSVAYGVYLLTEDITTFAEKNKPIKESVLNEYVKEQYEAYPTENITVPDEKMKSMKGNILIVGYFYKDLSLFNPEAKITVFLNNADVVDENELKHIKFIRADKDVGFLSSYVVSKIKQTSLVGILPSIFFDFCDYLDEYMYGNPTETVLRFKNGIYTHEGKTLLEKTQNAYRTSSLIDIIKKGKDLHEQNKHIAEKRYKEGKHITVEYKGKEYKGYVTYGDTAIIETLLHILKKPDIDVDVAILLRHNMKENKTFISLRTSDKLSAGHVAHELYKGGGSENMAGASVNGILIL